MKKLFVLIVALTVLSQAQTVQAVYNFPYYNPYNYFWGVCTVGPDLWIGTDYDNTSTYPTTKIYRVTKQGVIMDSVTTPFKFNHGLAYDGANFWIAEDYRTAGARVFKMSPAGVKLDSIQLPALIGGASGGIGGIDITGNFMWFTVYYPDFTSYPYAYAYKMDLTTRAIVDTMPLRGKQVHGITVKGDTVFYVTDNFQSDVERIYAYRKAVGDTIFSFPLPDPDGDSNPKGLHWDGTNLWLVADRLGTSSYAFKALYKFILGGSGTPILTAPNSIAFGDVTVGIPQGRTLDVNSAGTGDLRIDSLKIDNPLFTVSPTNTPHILPPGQSKQYTVTFAPVNSNPETATLKIYSSDAINPVKSIALSGTGVYGLPYIMLSHDTLQYGGRRVNSLASREIKITNLGGGSLRIDSIKAGTANYFMLNSQVFPQFIDSTKNKVFTVWFKPTALSLFTDTLRIYSNASNGTMKKVGVAGSGVVTDTALGSVIWSAHIPDNPNTTLQDYSAKNIKYCNDLNSDGIGDIIVTTDNYYTIAYNGNSSVTGDVIWKYNLYPSNVNTGNVERMASLQIASDLNGDGVNDVVIGTAGGGESVIAINGRTGERLWEFGDSINYNQGDIMGVNVARDFNNDGIPDVLATASGNESNLQGRFTTYCLNGLNGNVLWEINEAAEARLKYGVVSTDSGGAFGSRPCGVTAGRVTGFNRSGQVIWNFATPSAPWAMDEAPDMGGAPGSDVIIGDVSGNVYCVDGKTGQLIWQRSIGNAFVEDVFVINDVNGSGKKDILVSALVSPVYVLEGSTGSIIWTSNTGGTVLGAGQIPDITGDMIPEVGIGNLANYLRIYNGATGSEIFNWHNNTGSSSDAVECVWTIGNPDGFGAGDFVTGTRDGYVLAFSGGGGFSGQPGIMVTSPNGGENWATGSSHNITWTSTGVSTVKIEYTFDNGANWNVVSASMPAGQGSYGWTVPATPSTTAKVRITDVSNASIFDVSDNVFTISSSGNQAIIPLASGWNIVSMPLFTSNMTPAANFPLATSSAFGFNNGYYIFDTLQMNKGFWIRYPQAAIVTITGTSLSATALPVNAGWNLIGVHHYNVVVTNITTVPPGILNSSFFGYANGYIVPTTLEAGKGYWVRASQAGLMNIPMLASAKSTDIITPVYDKHWASVSISDADGNSSALYFANGAAGNSSFVLPPVPPAGVFDVRFTDGTAVQNADGRFSDITISGARYPVTIIAREKPVSLRDKATQGKLFNVRLGVGESAKLDNSLVQSIEASVSETPSEFELSQNFPNPFNPVTRIKYSLPEKSHIRIAVFNQLGEAVKELVNAELEAGYYSVDWNAASLSSGIYYYQMKTDKYSSVKKLMLMK